MMGLRPPLLTVSAMAVLFVYMFVSVASSATSHSATELVLVPEVAKSWSCRGFGGGFTVFYQLKLIVKNTGQASLVVPAVNNAAYNVSIAGTRDGFRTGRVELQIEPEVITVGQRRDFSASDFSIVRPSEGTELPLLVEIAIPAMISGAAVPGSVRPGEKWIRFTWDPWSEEESATQRWSRFFSRRGRLILDPIVSEPVRIDIPVSPKFVDCNEIDAHLSDR